MQVRLNPARAPQEAERCSPLLLSPLPWMAQDAGVRTSMQVAKNTHSAHARSTPQLTKSNPLPSQTRSESATMMTPVVQARKQRLELK